jgi:hypothetical protein
MASYTFYVMMDMMISSRLSFIKLNLSFYHKLSCTALPMVCKHDA